MAASALALQFEESLLSDLEECRQLGYNPTGFLDMVQQHGAVEATRRLILQPGVPYGFGRLWELHRLDLTLEAHIINHPEYHMLFGANAEAVVQAATERLQSVGYI